MNKTVIIIAIVVAALIGGGCLLINFSPEARALTEKIGIIDKPAPAPAPPSNNAVFIIFDPSGSGSSSYSVPRISTAYISTIIDSIAKHGTGEIWLTFIDKNGSNNKVLHYEIPSGGNILEEPLRQSGERKGDYDKRLAKFKTDSFNNANNVATMNQTLIEKKKQFLADCQTMIEVGYAQKKRGDDYSDCIGSLNAGLRSLETVSHDSLHFRSIIFISDGVQDLPVGVAPQKLNAIHEDIIIVTVNHSGSKNNIVKGHTVEVDNLDRALDKGIKFYNH